MMPHRWNENRLTAKTRDRLSRHSRSARRIVITKIDAAVSNFGGLGSFAAHGLTPGAIKDVIAEIAP